MTTNTATVAAALRRLAEAEETCRACQGLGEFQMYNRPEPGFTRRCSVCSGSGRVPLFKDAEGKALFRKACEPPHYRVVPGNWLCCEGRGWLPIDVSEVHGETLLLFAANNTHESLAGGQVFRLVIDTWEKAARTARTEQEFIEAAILALDAARAARA